MVDGIVKRILKSWYFYWSAITLLFFLGVIIFLWKNIESDLKKKANAIFKEVAVGNTNAVKNMFASYENIAFYIDEVFYLQCEGVVPEPIVQKIQKKEASIEQIQFVNNQDLGLITSSFGDYTDSVPKLLLKYPCKNHKDSTLLLKVNLLKLHHKIATSKDILHAYVTISFGNKFVFHPNERYIGKTKEGVGLGTKQTHKNFSSYLDMEVYRYYDSVRIGGVDLSLVANVITLDFQEYLAKRAKSLLWILLATFIAFSLIVVLGVFKWRKEFISRESLEQRNLLLALKNEQQKQTVIRTELEFLKSGLNPHFLFNAMSSLKILVDKSPALAKDFSLKLSNIYRYMLKHENKNIVDLVDEFDFTNDYIELQKVRFGNKILCQQEEGIFSKKYKIPPVSLQLLVENAIKHTIISEKKPLVIEITIQNDYLVVENNYNPRLSKIEHTGKGIENLEKRYSFLTEKKCSFYVQEGKYIAKIPLL
ncbi:MAG: histidine kinase [Flavobacteriaceae bacterium]|nr:histidine kinase [Flavobacteriaceae bacterium]